MKKMKAMRSDFGKVKSYILTGSLYSVRKTWEGRAYMLKVAGNYPNHRKWERTGWQCQACDGQVREDQDHLPWLR